MNYVNTAVLGSLPNNAMYVNSNITADSIAGDTSDWKVVFGDEARKINPLFDVGVQRNEMIQTSIQQDDWSTYNKFEAKQHPAWFEQVNGEAVPNKIYYGNLIKTRIEGLENAYAAGDNEAIAAWQHSLDIGIRKFNEAPGIVPYIVGLNHNERVANKYGVEEPAEEYFDSKYNDPNVLSNGKFTDNMWYDNAIFQANPALRTHVEELVDGTFPTSESFQTAQLAAKSTDPAEEIPVENNDVTSSQAAPQGSFQAGLMQTFTQSMQQTQTDIVAEELAKKADEENEKNVSQPNDYTSAASTTNKQATEETKQQVEKSSFDIQVALRDNLKNIQAEPNIIEVLNKYESA